MYVVTEMMSPLDCGIREYRLQIIFSNGDTRSWNAEVKCSETNTASFSFSLASTVQDTSSELRTQNKVQVHNHSEINTSKQAALLEQIHIRFVLTTSVIHLDSGDSKSLWDSISST